ncbi:nucleotidyltransferase family protein [Parafilimonas sp.]|uniref:nucleotidyltransferase family protein n=1 Tax=Parafilimonas sp. TaxID=1969739 RepID=UPI0039E4C82D
MILTKEQIQNVISDFFADKPVNKVWLFGSYARGDADEKSDVDVLIDIDKNAKVAWEYYGWFNDLSQLFNKKVDIVSHGWENKHIKPYIDKDKIVIYEK